MQTNQLAESSVRLMSHLSTSLSTLHNVIALNQVVKEMNTLQMISDSWRNLTLKMSHLDGIFTIDIHVHENHNSLGCKQSLGLDVKQSSNAQESEVMSMLEWACQP